MDARWYACVTVVAAAAAPGASRQAAATCGGGVPAAYPSRPARRPVSLGDRDRALTLRGGAKEGAGETGWKLLGGRKCSPGPGREDDAGPDGSSAADESAPLAQAERVMQAAQARLAAKTTSPRDQAPSSLADRRRADVLCPAVAPCRACPCSRA